MDAAGVYVPGGKAGGTPLVSSVLMGAVPARIAGVQRIVMATPPMADGRIDPHLLAAADRVGVNEVYRIGSAWAIAALAYGTETIQPVDTIVGPGNVYVTLAKKLVSGTVGIDMLAGPSEILVIADSSADPRAAAADLLSQAEHDPLASAVMLTDDASMARQVCDGLYHQLERLSRREIAAASLKRFGAIIVVPDMDTALDLAKPHRAGTSRTAGGRTVFVPGPDPQRRGGVSRSLHPGTGGRLHRRAQPRAAHRRYGPLFLGPFGGPFSQAHQRAPL